MKQLPSREREAFLLTCFDGRYRADEESVRAMIEK